RVDPDLDPVEEGQHRVPRLQAAGRGVHQHDRRAPARAADGERRPGDRLHAGEPRIPGYGRAMRAVQYPTVGSGPEVVEVPTPEPGPGQVRLKVTAAGLCHSDWFVMGLPAEQYAYGLP